MCPWSAGRVSRLIAWALLHMVAHPPADKSRIICQARSKSAEESSYSLLRLGTGRALLLLSHSVISDSLRPHGLQYARLPCPSPSPGAHSNSRPLNCWCHPAISNSVIPFFSCLQSFSVSWSFPESQLFASCGQSFGALLQHQSFQWIVRVDFL